MKIFFKRRLTSFIKIKWQKSKKEKEEHAVLFLWGFIAFNRVLFRFRYYFLFSYRFINLLIHTTIFD